MNLENRVKRLECVVSFLKCNALKEEEAFIFLKSINIDEKTGVTTEDIDVVIEQGNVYLLINPDNTFTLYTIDVDGNILTTSNGVPQDLNFIPLTGTEEGKPITGDLKIESYSGKKIKSYLQGEGGNAIDLTRVDEGLVLESYYGQGIDGVKSAELVVNGANVMYIPMNGAEESSVGFMGSIDHSDSTSGSAESDKLIYAQRGYVDRANSYTINETLTGGTWIDGKPIYRKVVNVPDFGTSNYFEYFYDSTFKIIKSDVLLKSLDQDTYITEYSGQTIPGFIDGAVLSSELSTDSSIIYINYQRYNSTSEQWESVLHNHSGVIIIEYTKTID